MMFFPASIFSVSKFQNSVGNLPKDEGLRKRAVLLKGPKRPRVL
jgi:hypothetical protein